MTLENVIFGFVMECDFCSEYIDLDTDDFQEAIDMAKDYGWKIRKVDGEWVHVCPACVDKGDTR